MFLFDTAISLYTVANTLILGLFAPPQLVRYYAGAEKINKAFIGLLGPMSQALYPRFSHLVHSSRDKATLLDRVSFYGYRCSANGVSCFPVGTAFSAHFVGAWFEPAIPVLRLLSLMIPFIAVGNLLGVQWMLPLGLRSFIQCHCPGSRFH
jgi:PST family polysaccharide transporter